MYILKRYDTVNLILICRWKFFNVLLESHFKNLKLLKSILIITIVLIYIADIFCLLCSYFHRGRQIGCRSHFRIRWLVCLSLGEHSSNIVGNHCRCHNIAPVKMIIKLINQNDYKRRTSEHPCTNVIHLPYRLRY